MVPPYFISFIFAFGKWSNHLDLFTQCFYFQKTAFRMPVYNARGMYGNAAVGMASACPATHGSPARRNGMVPRRESREAALLPPRRWRRGTVAISLHGTLG